MLGKLFKKSKQQWPDSLQVHVNDRSIEFNTSSDISKRWFYPRYQNGRPHEEIVLTAMLEGMTEKDIFFDVGANIGFFSTVIAALNRQTAVHSFEIDPDLIREIRSNFAANKITNANCLCAAIWNETPSFISFSPNHDENLSTNTIHSDEAQSDILAPAITLDQYCITKNIKPTIMKCDIEGAEVQALLGMTESMGHLRKLFLEVHPATISSFGFSLANISAILRRENFKLSIAKDHRSKNPEIISLSFDEFEQLAQNTMIICTRS